MSTDPKPEPKKRDWTQATVGDLCHCFATDGLDAARQRMKAKYGIAPEATDAKLAMLGHLTLDPDEIATIASFTAFLRAMDQPSRGLAMARLRAALKEKADV